MLSGDRLENSYDELWLSMANDFEQPLWREGLL